jgi:hypothetical protein
VIGGPLAPVAAAAPKEAAVERGDRGDDERGGRRFDEYLATSRREVEAERRPERPARRDEDALVMLSELSHPALTLGIQLPPLPDPEALEVAEDPGDALALVAAPELPPVVAGTGEHQPRAALREGGRGPAAGATADSGEPQMVEVEAAFEEAQPEAGGDDDGEAPPEGAPEPEVFPARRPEAQRLARPAAASPLAAPEAAPGAVPDQPTVEAPEPAAPLEMPEVSTPEVVPTLKHIKVKIDPQLSVEVSPSDADGVEVRLDGTPEALRSMADIEGELRDELADAGYNLDGFSSQEREAGGEAGSEGGAGSPQGAAATSEGEQRPRERATRLGLIDAVA